MEGSRHEKATLVALAYGIGALSAFIWFGLGESDFNISYSNVGQSASVISAVDNVPVESAELKSEPVTLSPVSYVDGLLEYTSMDGVRLLSFNNELSEEGSDSEFAEQGFHVGTLEYTVSQSGEYVFFCEKKTASSETCRPFVYDALTDTIYPVRKDGDLVDLLNSAVSAVHFTGSRLTIGSDTSSDQSKPWLLGNN